MFSLKTVLVVTRILVLITIHNANNNKLIDVDLDVIARTKKMSINQLSFHFLLSLCINADGVRR